MTKVYGVFTILHPGILKVTDDGKISHIDSLQNIKGLKQTGALNRKSLKSVKFPRKEDELKSVKLKVTILKGISALEVLYKTP